MEIVPWPIEMIDVNNLTNFSRTPAELEEFAFYCAMVTSSPAKTALGIETFLASLPIQQAGASPFETLRANKCDAWGKRPVVDDLFKKARLGPLDSFRYRFMKLVGSKRDLAILSVDSLAEYMSERGARLFIRHSRPGASCAILTKENLEYIRQQGIVAPSRIPTNDAMYRIYESILLYFAKQVDRSIVEFEQDILDKKIA